MLNAGMMADIVSTVPQSSGTGRNEEENTVPCNNEGSHQSVLLMRRSLRQKDGFETNNTYDCFKRKESSSRPIRIIKVAAADGCCCCSHWINIQSKTDSNNCCTRHDIR
jgi:hypothetical protein